MRSYLYKNKIITPILDIFRLYQKNGFDLVPVQRNGRIPIEKEWNIKSHKNANEWWHWYNELKLNMGVKTGKISGITIMDIDSKQIPEKLKKLLKDYKGMIQESNRGYHYFFLYEKDLPKTGFNFENIHIDIENNGGQVVIFPSRVDGIKRKFIQINNIPRISNDLKKFILNNVDSYKKISNEEQTKEDIKNENIDLNFVGKGNRNNLIVKFGGILRKELNIPQVEFVLSLFNKHFFKPSLPIYEIRNAVRSLDKYIKFDYKDLAQKILNYLRIVGDAGARDVKEVMNEKKEFVDKSLAFLVREGYIIKKNRNFHIIKKAEWKDTFDKIDNTVSFKVPYFNDIAVFNYGDMLLLGSKSKWGKTTISMNMIKNFVSQGIKPYYICLETGSRFQKTWFALGGKGGEFYWDFQADPTKIELEKESITIIDWLLIENKAETDIILKHFVEQLFKTNGFLIIFMQLKQNGGWFAPNMVTQFPSLAGRYLYDIDSDGTTGKWIIDVVREAKVKMKSTTIPCKYNWDTRELLVVK